MAERKVTSISISEREVRKKPFVLRATKREVGIGDSSEGQHPHFRMLLNVGEERLIDNLSFIVDQADQKNKTVKVTIRQFRIGKNGLSLDNVVMDGDVLLIGSTAQIVLRRFRQDGRPLFRVSAARNIKVRSRERLRAKAAS